MTCEPVAEPTRRRRGNAAARLRARLTRLADFVLPPLCLVCRDAIDGHGGLCPSCWTGVDFIRAPLCDRLGLPLPYAVGETMVSAAALADPPDYARARAVAAYAGPVRVLVQNFKYRDQHEGLSLFGRWLAMAGRELLREADLMVPVPLYRARLWTRRCNQAMLLAERIGRYVDVAADPFLLQRQRRTPPQVGLSFDQRRRNVSGAFRIPAECRDRIKGRSVVLVDDVITTGATANACARALTRAGAARVDVLALARRVDPLAPRL